MHKILIVDDSKPLLELVKVQLGTESFSFATASTGAEALLVAVQEKPDLILLDVDLPDMNGFDVCRFLKAEPCTAKIPVVFLTASTSTDERICALEVQATDFITKPFDFKQLNDRVRRVLRENRFLGLMSNDPSQPELSIH